MRVSGLYIYPVKGCRGIAVESARVDELGFEGDRRFMIVSPDGKMLTQRTDARLALVETGLSADALTLTYSGHGMLRVPRASEGAPLLTVGVWSHQGLQAEDCGDEPANWLTSLLGQTYRLVRIGRAFRRFVRNSDLAKPDLVTFADAYPFLAISDASLNDLNDRLAKRDEPPLPMNRFRPSFTISGTAPYAEDKWTRIRVGDLTLRSGGLCVRCIVTTTDQSTGERGKEPLKTLATYRRDIKEPTGVVFGQNMIHETKSGMIRVGDEVSEITPSRSP